MDLTRRSLLQLLGIGSAAALLPRRPALAEASVDAFTSDAVRRTRLETFLKSRGIKPAHLARESGYSRQHLLRVRLGRMTPSFLCIAGIVVTMRRLTQERIRPELLFEPHIIRTAWRDARLTELHDEERAEIRSAFGRRTLREFLTGACA